MQVHLISESKNRPRLLKQLLRDLSVPSVVKSPSRLKNRDTGIFIFFPDVEAEASEMTIDRLIERGNIIMCIGSVGKPMRRQAGAYFFPAETPDATIASLIVLFASFKDKEAHFTWITDELNKVNAVLREETERLKAARDELNLKNKKMTEELALANIVQNSLLPKEFPRDVPLNFCHKYIPHEYIGGDFFEILEIDDRHLGILIADVSGHGVSSALITAMLKSAFRHAAVGCLSPAHVLEKINIEFNRAMRTEHYITAFYAVIDTGRFTLAYAAAGHPRQLVIRRDGPAEPVGAHGFFLGMFESTVYEEKSLSLEPGDRLILFTDGLIECPDNNGRPFGQENLIRIVESNREDDIETLSKKLIVELIAFMAETRFPDDVTLLIGEIIPLL